MRCKANQLSDLAIPPGEYMMEVAETLDLDQAELARHLGRTEHALKEIVMGIEAITPQTAIRLEELLGVPARIWSGLESDYRRIREVL